MSGEAVYLDSSAIVKLVSRETESSALITFLATRELRTSCALARTEVVRAAALRGPALVSEARRVLATIAFITIDDALLDAAAALGHPVLRTLDAIHLAAAQALRSDLDWLITYDRRMAVAATALGIPVQAPGQT